MTADQPPLQGPTGHWSSPPPLAPTLQALNGHMLISLGKDVCFLMTALTSFDCSSGKLILITQTALREINYFPESLFQQKHKLTAGRYHM